MSSVATQAANELQRQLQGAVWANEPMNRHTSYRIGGPVSLYIQCASLRDLGICFEVLAGYRLPWAILGKGSNILVSDQGWPGAIITLGEQFRNYRLPSPDISNSPPDLMVAGAGVLLTTLVQSAFKAGIRGFEFAVGIPGTLGGALAMNAGTTKDWIGAIVRSLAVYRPGSGLRRIAAEELPWAYRQSGLDIADIIVEAELWARPGHSGQIRAKMEAALRRRKSSQPLTMPSAGSVFKNPPQTSAAKLIDDLGLKGLAVGGAAVSRQHANFIVNNGTATAADVLAIILTIKQRVKEAFGIELQNEIRFIGFET